MFLYADHRRCPDVVGTVGQSNDVVKLRTAEVGGCWRRRAELSIVLVRLVVELRCLQFVPVQRQQHTYYSLF